LLEEEEELLLSDAPVEVGASVSSTTTVLPPLRVETWVTTLPLEAAVADVALELSADLVDVV